MGVFRESQSDFLMGDVLQSIPIPSAGFALRPEQPPGK